MCIIGVVERDQFVKDVRKKKYIKEKKRKTKVMQIVSRVSELPFANFLAAMFLSYSN